MPQFTASLTSEGLELPVMIGLCSSDMRKLQATSAPVPRPEVVTGIIDTGSNSCCISDRVASLLGILPLRQSTTTTLAGPLVVNLYKVGLFIPRPGSTTEFLTVADSWTMSELPAGTKGIEAIVGRDLLAQLLLVLNGPRNEFALAG
jgi:hypothetical protein